MQVFLTRFLCRGLGLGVVLVPVLLMACAKKECVNRDRVSGKMAQAIALLQDGVAASHERSALASTQLTSAAGLVDSIAEDLAAAPVAAGEARVAAARLRAAVAELQGSGGVDGATRQVLEATKHFQAAGTALSDGSVPFCSEPQR